MRYYSTGHNNWTPRQKSGYTREYVYGALQPMKYKDDMPWWRRIFARD